MISDSFWTHDYATGVDTLMKALAVSIAENKQFLAMVAERARIHQTTASSLAQLSQEPVMHAVPVQADRYIAKASTLQSALSVFTTETVNQAMMHTRISSDIENRVRIPLEKWCDGYAQRVHRVGKELNDLVARYKTLVQGVQKQRALYYEQCHRQEDIGPGGGSPRDPIIKTIRILKDHLTTESPTNESRRASSMEPRRENTGSTNDVKRKTFTLAGLDYSATSLADLLKLIMQDIALGEYRVPLLGSYQNVTTGAFIAAATRKHVQNDSFAYAEKFGQALVDHGFLKPVGQISNRFQSTHTSHFQFQPLAFDFVAEESSDEDDTDSSASVTTQANTSTYNNGMGLSDVSEEQYLQAIVELDQFRCEMEIEIMHAYAFLDKLEQDREEAIKRGMQDYIRVSQKTQEQEQMISRTQAAQARVNPKQDLERFVLTHQTGPFVPTVTVFQGYSSGTYVQTFGVDLRHSHFLVSLVLNWLETLPRKDSKKVTLWTKPEDISEIYKLRAQINNGKPFSPDAIFRFFPISVVVSTLRQFLLELPESVISFIVYERFKQLYSHDRDHPPRLAIRALSPSSTRDAVGNVSPAPSEHPNSEDSAARGASVSAGSIATVLLQIPPINRAVLKQLVLYLRDRFPASEHAALAHSLALPLVRPRAPSAVTMKDTHSALLIEDLLRYGQETFHIVEVKQKEMDSSKEVHTPRLGARSRTNSLFSNGLGSERRNSDTSGSPKSRSDSPEVPSAPSPLGQSPSLTSASIRSLSIRSPLSQSPTSNRSTPRDLGSFSTAPAYLDSGLASGNSGLRPLSMVGNGRYTSYTGNLSPSQASSSQAKGPNDSPGRGLGISPILPIGHSPSRPSPSRLSSSTSSTDLRMPKLRLPKE